MIISIALLLSLSHCACTVTTWLDGKMVESSASVNGEQVLLEELFLLEEAKNPEIWRSFGSLLANKMQQKQPVCKLR